MIGVLSDDDELIARLTKDLEKQRAQTPAVPTQSASEPNADEPRPPKVGEDDLIEIYDMFFSPVRDDTPLTLGYWGHIADMWIRADNADKDSS